MSGQVKKMSGNILTARQIIDKILSINGLEQSQMAIKCEIIPNTLQKAIDRNKLSNEIVMKISSTLGVRKEFLRTGSEPIRDEKHTSAIKTEQPDIWEHPVVKNLIRELETTRTLVKVLERENEDLRGGKQK